MGRMEDYRRTSYYDRMDSYIQGNTVRQPEPSRLPQRREEHPQRTSVKTQQNREKALQMNFGYVLFLTAMAITVLFVCVQFLNLQAENEEIRSQVSVLEQKWTGMKEENDQAYDQLMNTVDLQHIKEIAINRLHMVRAKEEQVITYNSQKNDYIRQYEEVP